MSSPHAFSNALTFYEVPEDTYPAFEAVKDKLVERALSGEDVYVYHPVGNHQLWNIWINGERHDLKEWRPGVPGHE